MRISSLIVLAVLLLAGTGNAQFFRNFFRGVGQGVNNFFRPVMNMFHGGFRGGRGRDLDETGGTRKPVATGHDNPFPDDCGRDPVKKTGLLCFPDGILCRDSKFFLKKYPNQTNNQ